MKKCDPGTGQLGTVYKYHQRIVTARFSFGHKTFLEV